MKKRRMRRRWDKLKLAEGKSSDEYEEILGPKPAWIGEESWESGRKSIATACLRVMVEYVLMVPRGRIVCG